jgi:hypothetical protein
MISSKDCLGIDPVGVPTLIEIGRQKLATEQRSRLQLDLTESDQGSSPQEGNPR